MGVGGAVGGGGRRGRGAGPGRCVEGETGGDRPGPRAGGERGRAEMEVAGGRVLWRAGLDGAEIVAAFGAGTKRCPAPDSSRGEVARFLEVEEGAAGRVAMVAVWGGDDTAARARRLAAQVDAWIEEARVGWRGARPRCPNYPGLLESIADNLMWTVLLQPETGRLYAPAGRRWIFPRPPRASPGERPKGAPSADPVPRRLDRLRLGQLLQRALLLAPVSGKLAWAALLAGIASRYPNGNVPNWRSRRGGTPDRSQPPVGSFAALKLHLLHPNPDALATAYRGLLQWSDWWMADRRGRPRREGLTPGLLSWGSDTHLLPDPGRVPPLGGGRHRPPARGLGVGPGRPAPLGGGGMGPRASRPCHVGGRSVQLPCIRPGVPLPDRAPPRRRLHRAPPRRRAPPPRRDHEPASSGRNRPASTWTSSPPVSPARVAASNFLPLVAGVPSRARARRMVETLSDPNRFWGPWVVPTIPRDDPAFADQQYWRGSIWPPMNYLILQGLRRYGFRDLAVELAWRGADMFLADRHRTGMCRENFDSRTGQGRGRRFQSWGPLFALGALEEARSDGTPWRDGPADRDPP